MLALEIKESRTGLYRDIQILEEPLSQPTIIGLPHFYFRSCSSNVEKACELFNFCSAHSRHTSVTVLTNLRIHVNLLGAFAAFTIHVLCTHTHTHDCRTRFLFLILYVHMYVCLWRVNELLYDPICS